MDLRVAPSSGEAIPLTPLGRRGHYRHQIQSLAYVNLDQANGGVIRNLGDTGLAIQAVAPLYVNQQVFVRFDLANPRARIEATGRVAWADPVGQATRPVASMRARGLARSKRTKTCWFT